MAVNVVIAPRPPVKKPTILSARSSRRLEIDVYKRQVHEDAHIRITALIGKLSGGRRRGMDLVVLTLWLLFALWLTVEGCVLVGKIAAMGQVSSAMRIPMTIPYASVPIGGALMTIRLVQKIVEDVYKRQRQYRAGRKAGAGRPG